MKEVQFEWDQWNVQKNEIKHGVSYLEAESCFYDPHLSIYEDMKHSTQKEQRLIAYAKGIKNRILMLGFTLRGPKVRIITARTASKKERKVYEDQKKV